MARPSEYNFELCLKICDEIANGNNIIAILRGSEYPSWPTFRRWKNNHEELRTLYINSQQDKGIALENEIDDVMISLRNGELEPSTANVLIQTLKWKMAKFYPKLFGERVEIDQKTTSINYSLTDLTEEEKQTLFDLSMKVKNED